MKYINSKIRPYQRRYIWKKGKVKCLNLSYFMFVCKKVLKGSIHNAIKIVILALVISGLGLCSDTVPMI